MEGMFSDSMSYVSFEEKTVKDQEQIGEENNKEELLKSDENLMSSSSLEDTKDHNDTNVSCNDISRLDLDSGDSFSMRFSEKY
jgi:hypothetical protein